MEKSVLEEIIKGYKMATKALCETLAAVEFQKCAELTPRGTAGKFRFLANEPDSLRAVQLPPELTSLYNEASAREARLRSQMSTKAPPTETHTLPKEPPMMFLPWTRKEKEKRTPSEPRKEEKKRRVNPLKTPNHLPELQICQSKKTAPQKMEPRRPESSASDSTESQLQSDLYLTDSETEAPKEEEIIQRKPVMERTLKDGKEMKNYSRQSKVIDPRPQKRNNV